MGGDFFGEHLDFFGVLLDFFGEPLNFFGVPLHIFDELKDFFGSDFFGVLSDSDQSDHSVSYSKIHNVNDVTNQLVKSDVSH